MQNERNYIHQFFIKLEKPRFGPFWPWNPGKRYFSKNRVLKTDQSIVLGLYWWYYSLLLQWSSIWSQQQLELASELESDLWTLQTWALKWLEVAYWSQCWKNSTGFITLVLLMWKMDGSVPEERSSLTMLGLTFSSKMDQSSYNYLSCLKCLQENRKHLEPWFILWSSFLLRLDCNLPYGHAWNTIVMSGLVLLVAS